MLQNILTASLFFVAFEYLFQQSQEGLTLFRDEGLILGVIGFGLEVTISVVGKVDDLESHGLGFRFGFGFGLWFGFGLLFWGLV